MRKTNDAGLALIREFEGTKLRVYRDPVGLPTVGTGHLVVPSDGLKVGDVITDEQAKQFLRDDLVKAEQGVEKAIGDAGTDNQFAACVSLAFNIGVGAFAKSSIVKFMVSGEPEKAAARFSLYNKSSGKVLPGLTRRRAAERLLFLTPDESVEVPDEPEDAPAESVTETVTKTTAQPATETQPATVEQSIVQKITSSDQVKEIASTGLSTVGNKLATGGISTGLLASIGAFVDKAWPLLIFAGVLIVLGFSVWMLIYHNQHKEKQIEAQIASDPARVDVHFAK